MERKRYIDVAKGIAMLCIIMGHLGIYNINRVVYTFMVSIFFVISGYFINDKRDIKNFIINKFKRLIIPYIFVSIIMTVLAVVVNEISAGGMESKQVAKTWIIAMLFGTGGSDVFFGGQHIHEIGAIWFLLAMFWGTIVFRLLLELKPSIRMIIIVSILFVSVWSAKILFLPLSIQPGGVALFFIYIGYLIKQAEPYFKDLNWEIKAVCTVIAFCCWLESILDYQWFLLVLADVGRGITDVFRSICGCYIIMLFSKVICKNGILSKFLSFVGEYSILILSVHLIELNFFPGQVFKNWLLALGLSDTVAFWGVVMFRICMIIMIVLLLSKCNLIRKIYGFKLSKKENANE